MICIVEIFKYLTICYKLEKSKFVKILSEETIIHLLNIRDFSSMTSEYADVLRNLHERFEA